MTHWNHRVVKKVFEDTEREYTEYSVRKVFYNNKWEIYAYTEEPVDLACESLEALREYIEWCLKALNNPILEDGKVKFATDDITDKDLENLKSFDTVDEMMDDLNSEDVGDLFDSSTL